MSETTQAITFCPAQPDDCASVLPLIYSSGPAQLDYVFTQPSKSAQEFLRWAFLSGRGLFGYPIYTVALRDQHPVAIGAGYDRQQGKAFERQMPLQIIRF